MKCEHTDSRWVPIVDLPSFRLHPEPGRDQVPVLRLVKTCDTCTAATFGVVLVDEEDA